MASTSQCYGRVNKSSFMKWLVYSCVVLRNKLHVFLMNMFTGLTIMVVVEVCSIMSAKSYRFLSCQACSLVRRYVVGALRCRSVCRVTSSYTSKKHLNSHVVRHLQAHSYVRTHFGLIRPMGYSFRSRGPT